MFRLQKEMSACLCVHVVSERQQVCSRDEIVILLYDRLWRKRLKKEAKRKEEILLEGQKDGKKPKGGSRSNFSCRVMYLESEHLILKVKTPNVCKCEALIRICLKSLIQLRRRRK